MPILWKFTTGDREEYRLKDFDDAHWKELRIGESWESQGYTDYDGIAWYRCGVDLPPEFLKKDLVLRLGAIDDADETYFNGIKIGGMGKFPPEDQSAWDAERKYIIPGNLVKERNVLAVRVFDGIGGGGMYSGVPEMMPRGFYEKERKRQLKNGKSWHKLTTSNGLTAAVYHAGKDEIEAAWPHIFSTYDSADYVQPFGLKIKLLTGQKWLKSEYRDRTHVIQVDYSGGLTVFWFASFTRKDKILYAVARGKPELLEKVKADFSHTEGFAGLYCYTQPDGRTEKCFMFSFTDKYHPDPPPFDATIADLQKAKRSLADLETEYMRNVFKSCSLPEKLSKKERAVAEQSIAVLKMAQVDDREIFPLAKGQILASLRPGVWSIAWVRDAAFALGAMTRIGMFAEAKKGLEFMLNASPTNQYKHYIHTDGKDYGIKSDYRISVTRYFGKGREESDFNEKGPNIEIDDFGLFLIAFSDYVEMSGDLAFFNQWKTVLENEIADPIINNIDQNDLIRADSGPWEHHLPGRQFVFTSAVCGRGLERIGDVYDRAGYASERFRKAAMRLREGIKKNCSYQNRLIKGNAQDTVPTDRYFFDAAVFEVFACDFIHEPELFASHMDACAAALKTGDGYIRINSDDTYENQEWPFAGLRVATAHMLQGKKSAAKPLIDRITKMALANHGLIPEILTRDEGLYKGAVPMVGYGAGAYLWALHAYYGR